ncbi:WXG100 family type VII secretion target [Brevibacterium daeguense]|jgi:WXG100 family type VII secretion target|uniref:ESAT-6-like protein n=1 Tax=Brevibacterium daeguense TaxID=909936 RepID=A0ABP8EGK0_9MICO|nr:WXG100 family type VII secretion target [Brevibacterium daeguense]
MSILEVDANRVMSTAATATRSVAVLSAEVDALMRHLRALNECWRGSAAQNFNLVVEDWEGVQRRVHESLESIKEALHVAGRQYTEVEDANTRLFMR